MEPHTCKVPLLLFYAVSVVQIVLPQTIVFVMMRPASLSVRTAMRGGSCGRASARVSLRQLSHPVIVALCVDIGVSTTQFVTINFNKIYLPIIGACILGSQWSFSQLKTLTGLKRAHIEAMRGKPEDSLAYCSKQDAAPFVKGSLPEPGKRKDLEVAAEQILEGKSLRELATGDLGGAVAVVKFHKGLTVLRSVVLGDNKIAPVCIWLHGETGVGKTRCAFEFGASYAKRDQDVWCSSGGLRWFDGYDGQRVAILDELRAKSVPNFPFLLRVLDRYPLQVEFKGGFVAWNPEVIIITSNRKPSECFVERNTHKPEDIRQLERRLHFVHECIATDDIGRAELLGEMESIVRRERIRLGYDKPVVEEAEEASVDLAELGSSSSEEECAKTQPYVSDDESAGDFQPCSDSDDWFQPGRGLGLGTQ